MEPQDKAPTTRQILVVEDEEKVRNLLRRVAISLGHIPLEASNVKEALAHIAEHHVDLMLLDLHLGAASGNDLLKVLRSQRQKVPTLVVSAHVSLEVTEKLMDLGVLGIVVKPFKIDRLISEIQRILSNKTIEW